jgi:hypothetical protein
MLYRAERKAHPSALVLLHMDELMRADARKKRVIEADDNVAESDRGEASAGRGRRHQVMQVTAGDLDHASTMRGVAPAHSAMTENSSATAAAGDTQA